MEAQDLLEQTSLTVKGVLCHKQTFPGGDGGSTFLAYVPPR